MTEGGGREALSGEDIGFGLLCHFALRTSVCYLKASLDVHNLLHAPNTAHEHS